MTKGYSCFRCNNWKKNFPLEDFRKEIEAQVERLKRDSAGFRLALDYGTINKTGAGVVFQFER